MHKVAGSANTGLEISSINYNVFAIGNSVNNNSFQLKILSLTDIMSGVF